MNDQTNEVKDTNKSDMNETMSGFAKAVEFCKRNVIYIAVAGLFIVLVIVLVKFMGNDSSPNTVIPETETVAALPETETPEDFEKDVYPEINELINQYYEACADGKMKKLAKLAEPISDAEKEYINVLSQYVNKYNNISCYTKKGLDDDSFIVSVYLEIKFKKIKTTAPGLETFYVRKKEDGSYFIDNLYGEVSTKINDRLYKQLDSSASEFEVDEAVSALIEEFNQQDDVVALQTEVQQKYEAALEADEELKTMVEVTIPDAMTVWASDQVALVKKAEEEAAAAEEAAKKAEEEEAAKKAEEEQKASELASAVTVYATDKVNVRADASETADILGQLEVGAKTTRLEEKDGWSRIDYNGETQGYVKSEYLSTEAPAAPEPAEETPTTTYSNGFAEGTVITIKESVNVRKSMSEDAEKIATAFAGEKVTVIMSYAEGWTKVTYGDKTGFIKTELLQ